MKVYRIFDTKEDEYVICESNKFVWSGPAAAKNACHCDRPGDFKDPKSKYGRLPFAEQTRYECHAMTCHFEKRV